MIETQPSEPAPDNRPAAADAGLERTGHVTAGSGLEPTGDPAADAALELFAQAVQAMNALDLESLIRLDRPSSGLHAAARGVEVLRRRLGIFDARYVAAVECGGEPGRYACHSTAVFLREQLRLTQGEARRRVELAHAITPAVAFTGEVLPAPLPALAAAVAAGEVSGEHARTIIDTMAKLPTPVREEHGSVVEVEMVAAAGKVTPTELAHLATNVLVRADPDGVLRDVEYAHEHRDLKLVKNRGRAGGKLIAELDAETYELAQVCLDAVSKPHPATPTGHPGQEGPAEPAVDGSDPAGLAGPVEVDPRTAGQRQHDGLKDIFVTVVNSGDLPASGGTPASLVITMTEEQARTRYGLAVTDNGTLIPVPDALRLADQAELFFLITTATKIPLWLGRLARIATPGQTRALAVRDRGCSFPGCHHPPSFCQRHHIRDWLPDGLTDIDNLTLLCGYHHREFAKRGWACVMRDGQPYWIPPAWLDPHQTPIRNTSHLILQ